MAVVIAAAILLAGVAIFFRIPYSPARARFGRLVGERVGRAAPGGGVFTEADIAGLPAPVARYFERCGYLGTPKMAYMRAELAGVDFVMSPARTVVIDYQQFNLVERPERFALILSSLSGMPFEGLDSFAGGIGRMEGRLAKLITLFDQTGEVMNRACLVTWLAECLMAPSAALQPFVSWESIDDERARARIEWQGVSASGVFTFAADGELQSFRTGDRVAVDADGRETQADWSAYFLNYHSVDGIWQPSVIQSTWHYEDGDVVYFNKNAAEVAIRYR
ncbi:MAG: hypothetical protein GX558_03080 [Clostridiales bacterium]|nr:hypothetical protein [Clostridiales bacterium]